MAWRSRITPEHFIEAVDISKARYMGQGQPEQLNLNPWLNALTRCAM